MLLLLAVGALLNQGRCADVHGKNPVSKLRGGLFEWHKGALQQGFRPHSDSSWGLWATCPASLSLIGKMEMHLFGMF